MNKLVETVQKFIKSAAANADPELSFRMANPKAPIEAYMTADGKSRTRVGLTISLSFDSPGDSDFALATVANAAASGNFFQSSDPSKTSSEDSSQQSNPTNS